MKPIDENKLESDLSYRFGYLAEFMGFGAEDIELIHGTAPFLQGRIPMMVDAIYDKLQSYDSTWRHFVPRQHGYEGAVPGTIGELNQSHPQIQFRKQHLGRYLAALVSKPYDGKMVTYLDAVGKVHTLKAGSPNLNVPLVQMNAMMGFVSDAVTAQLFEADLKKDDLSRTVRAFQKLLWLQNDLINRHYFENKVRE